MLWFKYLEEAEKRSWAFNWGYMGAKVQEPLLSMKIGRRKDIGRHSVVVCYRDKKENHSKPAFLQKIGYLDFLKLKNLLCGYL